MKIPDNSCIRDVYSMGIGWCIERHPHWEHGRHLVSKFRKAVSMNMSVEFTITVIDTDIYKQHLQRSSAGYQFKSARFCSVADHPISVTNLGLTSLPSNRSSSSLAASTLTRLSSLPYWIRLHSTSPPAPRETSHQRFRPAIGDIHPNSFIQLSHVI